MKDVSSGFVNTLQICDLLNEYPQYSGLVNLLSESFYRLNMNRE